MGERRKRERERWTTTSWWYINRLFIYFYTIIFIFIGVPNACVYLAKGDVHKRIRINFLRHFLWRISTGRKWMFVCVRRRVFGWQWKVNPFRSSSDKISMMKKYSMGKKSAISLNQHTIKHFFFLDSHDHIFRIDQNDKEKLADLTRRI